jgi:hypothetical protein
MERRGEGKTVGRQLIFVFRKLINAIMVEEN